MKLGSDILCAVLVIVLSGNGAAGTFHVAVSGDDDLNPGTEDLPWRTIQFAADSMQGGDTVIAHAGEYAERISSVRGGSDDSTRIVFEAAGVVTVRGFSINHPYVSVNGFDVTGHSAPSKLTGHIEVRSNGDFARILNNTVRDGIALGRTDFVFTRNTPAANTVSSSSGGFLAAGFRPGVTVQINRMEKDALVANAGKFVLVDSVTDNLLTLSPAFNPFNKDIVSDTPSAAYLSGSPNFGLVLHSGASNVHVRGNRFSNLSFETAWIGGDSNVVEGNEITQCNGFNSIVYSGTDHVFRRNLIHDSPSTVYITSPDAMENWSTITSRGIVFEENFIENFEGPLGVHHLQSLGENADLVFRRNVFINAGSFVMGFPNTSFINNTLYRISREPTKAASADQHPLNFANSAGRFSSEGAVIKNNIFVACGDASKDADARGWYSMGSTSSYSADFNFVAGVEPGFAPKAGFTEGRPNLNGGDPGFLDIANPLGPDGLPFTADDGLRLAANSKLHGAGEGGMDLGAYAVPQLELVQLANGNVRAMWPVTAGGYFLQTNVSLTDEWSNLMGEFTEDGVFWSVDSDTAENPSRFFRLAR